jgi:DNA polymerase epsilon subunit 3
MSGSEPQDADLPKALLKRLIKAKLQDVDKAKGGDGTRDFQVNKDALLAFGEAAKLFIHYLTAAANDNCKDAKRQTISADDVMSALNDLEFGELVEPLKQSLEAFKAENREKNKKKQEAASKKRKPAAGAAAAAEEAEEDGAAAAEAEAAEGEEGEKRQKGDDAEEAQPMDAEEPEAS